MGAAPWNEDASRNLAAQQTWDASPWWLKGLIGLGHGANRVIQSDVIAPGLFLGEKAGLARKGAHARYVKGIEEEDAPFDHLTGAAPGVLSDIGSTSMLLPAAMATNGLVDSAMPEAGGARVMGLLRRLAPASAGGAAVGALEPEQRGTNALMGALAPVAAMGLGAAAPVVGFPLLRALKESGHLNAGRLYNILIGGPDAARHAAQAIPRAVGPPLDVLRDLATDRIEQPVKSLLQRALFESGAPATEDEAQRIRLSRTRAPQKQPL